MGPHCAFCYAASNYTISHRDTDLPVCFHCLNIIIEYKENLIHTLAEKMPHRHEMYTI